MLSDGAFQFPDLHQCFSVSQASAAVPFFTLAALIQGLLCRSEARRDAWMNCSSSREDRKFLAYGSVMLGIGGVALLEANGRDCIYRTTITRIERVRGRLAQPERGFY